MKNLKTFLVSQNLVAADATDEQVKAAAATAIRENKLTVEKYTELLTSADEPNKLELLIEKAVAASLAKLPKPDVVLDNTAKNVLDAAAKAATVAELKPDSNTPTPHQLLGKAADVHIRVAKATERYKQTRRPLIATKGAGEGRPLMYFDSVAGMENNPIQRQAEDCSEAEYAKFGAIAAKRMLQACGINRKLPEHWENLLLESAHEDAWVGLHGQKTAHGRKLTDFEQKAVLDDGTSGGSEAVPEWFDFAAIATPLLHSELLPYVQVVRVPRGSAADSYTIGTSTFVSTASGTGVTPFTTTSFVGAFDTTFFPATCAIEFGLDFLEDAAPQFGEMVMNQIRQEHLRWLDEQIAVGDGTTEPQGIFTASTQTVTPESSHTYSSFSYNDVLNLAFGIDKAHRNAFGGTSTRFVMNDSQYKKLMQIVTGVTGDKRPIFGMGIKDYMLGDYPVSVQNNIANGNMALSNLRGYRLYQRQGLQFLEEEAGRTLRLANTRLVMARTRWGGKITLTTFTSEITA